jgi:hypothetical protein
MHALALSNACRLDLESLNLLEVDEGKAPSLEEYLKKLADEKEVNPSGSPEE